MGRWTNRTAISLGGLIGICALFVFAATPARAAVPPPTMPSVIRSATSFTITGTQAPRPPYSSAGTLELQHDEGGFWRSVAGVDAITDAAFLVRPIVGARAGLVSATPLEDQGENMLSVSVAAPVSGVGNAPTADQPAAVRVTGGAVFAQSSRRDGTSTAFSGVLFQRPFVQDGLIMRVIAGPVSMRSPAGDLLQVFSAAPADAPLTEARLFVCRNGSVPTLLMSEPGLGLKVHAPLLRVGDGVLMTYFARDATGTSVVHVARWDAELRVLLSDQTVCGSPGYTYQAYSAVRCSDGSIVLPFLYTSTRTRSSGLHVLDVAISRDDGASWTILHQPRTISDDAPFQAGIMEPTAVETEPGTIAILFRCAAGHIGRVDLDLASENLGQPFLTDLEAPLAGLAALRLDSGAIALAWEGCEPDPGDPMHPRKVIVLGISEDGLSSFSSMHVICTSDAVGDSMVTRLPYVHQPKLSEVDGKLLVSVDRVLGAGDARPYLYTQCGPILLHNVFTPGDGWESVSMGDGAARLDLLAAFGPATFDAAGMVGPQGTWSATTQLPTGGRWRVRLVTEHGASAWRLFAVDRASFAPPALSSATVTSVHPALMTSRLLSASGEPLGSMPVQLLRDGKVVKSLTSAADGTVGVRVLCSKPAYWSFRSLGTDTIARATSAAVRTVPKYAMRVVVPASGIGSARGYLKRGVTFALVKTGHLHGALLRGPSGERIHIVPATSAVRTRTTGYFSARVSMPGGGTLIVW